MRRLAVALLLMAGGCGQQATAVDDGTPGGRLEVAAKVAGLVADPATASLVGAWSRDTDRICIVPDEHKAMRLGVLVDYGEGQGCAASGTVVRSGNTLDVRLGACRITASFDGDRIVFPASVPSVCDRVCVGRASLAALGVDRQSASVSEAATLRAPSGRELCATND